MNNLYNSSSMNTCERIITLEDYSYGSMVKCTIPTMIPFAKKEELRISRANIVNKKNNGVNIDKVITEDFVLIKIPKYLYDEMMSPIVCPHPNTCHHAISGCIDIQVDCTDCKCLPKTGKKGDVFIGMCIGGDINKLNIISKE